MALSYGFCLDSVSSTYTSEQFAAAFHAVFGDGIGPYGGQFALTLESNFTFSLASGFAFVNGRWIKNDEPHLMTLSPAWNTSDRYDAVAARVDVANRLVSFVLLEDVDTDAIQQDPAIIRNQGEYCILLYKIFVQRGATVLSASNVEDLRENSFFCGYISPADELGDKVLYIYRFLASGIDEEVDRLLGLSQAAIDKAEAAVEALNASIGNVRSTVIGDMMNALTHPLPVAEWLLCDGGPVPAQYPVLSALLGGTLPEPESTDSRFQYWIYGGKPV